MEYMSAAHVAAMNAILADSATVKAACAQLDGPRVLSFALTDGPGGETVHWAISFRETVRFDLAEEPAPDVRIIADWARMIRASQAAREGREEDIGMATEGATEVLAEVNHVFETARAVATIPVDFPPVGDRAGDRAP